MVKNIGAGKLTGRKYDVTDVIEWYTYIEYRVYAYDYISHVSWGPGRDFAIIQSPSQVLLASLQ